LVCCAADRAQDADRLLKSARSIETVDGNLRRAIAQYRKVIQTGVRKASAEALLGIADCHRKLGDAEAKKFYEQILREYADQTDTAAVARARLGIGADRDASGIVAREVWSGPGVDILGSVSPDGRHLSFTDWESGDLAVRDLTTGQNRRLTTKGSWTVSGEFAEESIFSHDGKHIIYSWYRKDIRWDIRRIAVAGPAAVPQVLYESKNVDWIAPYHCTSNGRFVAVQFHERDSVTQIGLIDTQDNSLRVLKRVSLPQSERMFFSPDDRYLAFDLPASEDSDQRDVYVMSIDGSREFRAVAGKSMDVVMGWTPDGSHLLFGSDRSGAMSLWAQRVRD
jgi:Tol biopolymer transport system component